MQAKPGTGSAPRPAALAGHATSLLRLASCCGVALAASAGVGAEHRLQVPIDNTLETWTLRQEMQNFQDTQYVANITLGGQVISGIIDTGSFELVVFEANCTGCGQAGRYREGNSSTHAEGLLTRGLFYGSGDVYAREAFDQLSIGPYPVITQAFWQVYEATMCVLQSAHFQAIIGIGPSQMPRAEAWEEIAGAVKDIKSTIEAGREPTRWQQSMVKTRMDFYREIVRTPTMIDAFHISTFSLCLLNEPGARGYFVWNDSSAFEQPGLFRHIRVIGRHTWTVQMTGVHLNSRSAGAESIAVGCGGGCGAIVDSGTSLLMMPADSVKMLEQKLKMMGALNCSNLEEMPDLSFRLDGQLFSLPPDAYLAEDLTDIPSFMADLVHVRTLDVGDPHRCKLTVMESYSTSHWGPLWILGMPFFRRYYTTFDVGRTSAERSLFIAPANSECSPEADATEARLQRSVHRTVYRRHIRMSDVYMSPLVRKAMQKGKVLDL